jgi:hypothetical protein
MLLLLFNLTMNLTLIAWPTEELDYLPRLDFLDMHNSLSVKKEILSFPFLFVLGTQPYFHKHATKLLVQGSS